jgi:outer membrane protein OmpA-like peptidoglycan-associated protein
MRRIWLLLPLLTCASATAFAQVTVDLHALDGLPGSNAQPSKPAQRLPAPRRVTTAKPKAPAPEEATATPPAATPTPVSPNQPAGTAVTPPAATLPTGAPPDVALAPIAPPPPEPQGAAPPPPAISQTSVSAATPNATGLQVTFGSGQSDLSPSSATALENLVKTTQTSDGTSFNVVAYAAGTPGDPSTARRLSLSRALVVRGALISSGISSSHIYVRALGASEGDQTPDRVDVAVLGANAPSAEKSAKQ